MDFAALECLFDVDDDEEEDVEEEWFFNLALLVM